jgi:hypothetical protein
MNEGSYVNLVAGDVVKLYIEQTSNANIKGSNSDSELISFIRMNQLPTHTVVPTISEEATPVNDQASSGYVDIGTMRIQWGTLMASTVQAFTYPQPFGNAPNLTGSLTEDGSQSTNLQFRDVTEIGASAALRKLYLDSWETATLKVSWIAIGLKP